MFPDAKGVALNFYNYHIKNDNINILNKRGILYWTENVQA